MSNVLAAGQIGHAAEWACLVFQIKGDSLATIADAEFFKQISDEVGRITPAVYKMVDEFLIDTGKKSIK